MSHERYEAPNYGMGIKLSRNKPALLEILFQDSSTAEHMIWKRKTGTPARGHVYRVMQSLQGYAQGCRRPKGQVWKQARRASQPSAGLQNERSNEINAKSIIWRAFVLPRLTFLGVPVEAARGEEAIVVQTGRTLVSVLRHRCLPAADYR